MTERIIEGDLPRIDNFLTHIQSLNEAVTDTGRGIVAVMGIQDFAKVLANRSEEEIIDQIIECSRLPEILMRAKPENSHPITVLYAFVDNEVSKGLKPAIPDAEVEVPEE